MKVLLTTLNAKYIHTNLAIRLLYAQNHQAHPGLEWKEFTIKQDKDETAHYCAQYDIVAFSCYIWNITQTLDVAARIKAKNPATKILLGGPEVSYDWQEIITTDQVDYIITGEGEIPFQRFLLSYPYLGEVPNLVHKEHGEVLYNPQNVTFDLKEYQDINPYAYEPAEDLAHKVVYIETSRGCPYKCEFCLASLDNKVRYLPNDTIKKQLLFVMQHGRVIKFLDRTFNVKRDFSLDIFQYILSHHKPGNVFQFEITADILHPDLIRYIEDHVPAGLFRFEIGIQSVSREVNLAVSRKQHFHKIQAVVETLRHKIEMHLDLIVGLPLEYWDDVKYSFETVFALHPPELQLGFLKFLKGTPMRSKHAQHGYVFDSNPPYQIIKSQYLSREELRKIEEVEHALEILWNKKRCPRMLKYVSITYGVFDFLLHFGDYWGKRHDFHRYSLNNVFDSLTDFVQSYYPDDPIMHQLLAIDYHLSYKTRPKASVVPEIDKVSKSGYISQTSLDARVYRFIGLPLTFDLAIFDSENRIEAQNAVILFAYNGVNQPLMLNFFESMPETRVNSLPEVLLSDPQL